MVHLEQWRTMARYGGEMPQLKEREFFVLSPEVSGGTIIFPPLLVHAERWCSVIFLIMCKRGVESMILETIFLTDIAAWCCSWGNVCSS